MQLYKFRSRDGVKAAITADETGSNLPNNLGPWKLIGPPKSDAEVGSRIGASTAEIIAGIKKDGFFILPARKGKS